MRNSQHKELQRVDDWIPLFYNSEEEVTNDIADPGTSTTEEDIQRDVTIFAPRLGMGATNKSE